VNAYAPGTSKKIAGSKTSGMINAISHRGLLTATGTGATVGATVGVGAVDGVDDVADVGVVTFAAQLITPAHPVENAPAAEQFSTVNVVPPNVIAVPAKNRPVTMVAVPVVMVVPA
jgi:hypothetical protein